jgi:Ca2+-dependent lipid-binding protein
MHEKCSHCGLIYQIEPSVFYGAMYVSYGLNVATGIAAFLVSYLIFGSTKTAFIAIIIVLIALFPYVLRWARNIYINMFVTYDPNGDKNNTYYAFFYRID